MRGIYVTCQADLVEMIPYFQVPKGFKYFLTVIDIFSKYAWFIPVKSKTGKDITIPMKSILVQDRISEKLHIDKRKEFYNSQFKRLMKSYNIKLYSTYSNLKA